MPAKKINAGARVTRIVARPSSTAPSTGVVIELTTDDASFAAGTLRVFRSREGKAALREFLSDQLDEPLGVERPGRIQPLIPVDLNDRFKALGVAKGKGNRHRLIKNELKKLFDLETGKNIRKKAASGKDMTGKFSNNSRFCEQAEILNGAKDKTRFNFVAGSDEASSAIQKYVKKNAITLSGFFAALIERICDADVQQDHKPEMPAISKT
jgi:hypothetical protein